MKRRQYYGFYVFTKKHFVACFLFIYKIFANCAKITISCRLLLNHCFKKLRSTQVAIIHCNAQTSPLHVIQKLTQTCMAITTNTGRVYKPKECERLILYLKDLNLPKPDKWGTSQLVAFLQQVLIFHTRLYSSSNCISVFSKPN